MSLSAVLITRNEEHNIQPCLESIRWADEIIVLDSGSNDRTVDIAKQFTPHVSYHPFKNFADQKNAALAKASKDWIFFIDADERVTPKLQSEIQSIIGRGEESAYKVYRLNFFCGKPLRFSGSQYDAPIRLFPRGKVSFEQPVHEHIVTALPVKALKEKLLHYSTRDFQHYRQKLDQYVALELETMALKNRKVSFLEPWIRPLLKFIKLYLLDFGILDGLNGLRFAMLSANYDYLKLSRYRKRARTSYA